jgi:dipeptide/tripeptide permease
MNQAETVSPVASVAKATAPERFPSQIKYIIGNEACERFSYYGMFGILELYLTLGPQFIFCHSWAAGWRTGSGDVTGPS